MNKELSSRYFSILSGTWDLEKIIEPEGAFSGQANFSQNGDLHLDYLERGSMNLNGNIFSDCKQEYIFQLVNGEISVYFVGFRKGLFQTLGVVSNNELAGKHYCGDDTYNSRYVLISDDAFEIHHTITGPKKDYLIHCQYKRA
jgi:hypothetical protein